MGEVPEHIMEEAQDVAFDCDPTKTSDQIANTIALALLAAEKRGREEAAKIADNIGAEIRNQARNPSETQLGKSMEMVAAAIRSGQ